MDIYNIIKRPWKNPVEYSELIFWFVIFLVAAYAMADGMRVAMTWIKNTAVDAVLD